MMLHHVSQLLLLQTQRAGSSWTGHLVLPLLYSHHTYLF